ncbi:PIN domain nuclease [Streptomyces scopuliridis]|uniref:PIN domain nuclease n=1 Tax=Streptomyces scopuliridis TaxID=452529 RepID=A0ACD4ZJK0_9ACTN|nr:PIN domain nuclease [Streptomyces scopuliridis]WSB98657.1 PIN domain nuclease [Streptomyces scopuliridis]WSC07640.1 PIN domain nuclease [Streptomyces scopuliridis]
MQDRYLIDKSALARWTKPGVKEVLKPLHERYLIAVCQPTEYEMIHSARDNAEATRISTWLHAFDYLLTDEDAFGRALEIQRHALNDGFHRALSLPDLLIAATAELNGRTVLHYDGDFDMIASLTGQPAEWVVPPGNADR